jgi:hypothetical protein
MNPDDQSPSGPTPGPEPIEPGRPYEPRPDDTALRQVRKNRGDLVVLLGIGSLFCCPPMGLFAWIMASTDLKRIRAGEMSSEGLSTLRAGRLLGIIGTLLFGMLLVGSGLLLYHLPRSVSNAKFSLNQRLEDFRKNLKEDLKPHPLAKDQLVYAGEWVGDRGTLITIRRNGTGDCKYRKDNVTKSQAGVRVRIQDGKLSIGIFGFYSTWRIEQPPTETHGKWTMTLDGEIFTKKRSVPTRPEEKEIGPGPREYEV